MLRIACALLATTAVHGAVLLSESFAGVAPGVYQTGKTLNTATVVVGPVTVAAAGGGNYVTFGTGGEIKLGSVNLTAGTKYYLSFSLIGGPSLASYTVALVGMSGCNSPVNCALVDEIYGLAPNAQAPAVLVSNVPFTPMVTGQYFAFFANQSSPGASAQLTSVVLSDAPYTPPAPTPTPTPTPSPSPSTSIVPGQGIVIMPDPVSGEITVEIDSTTQPRYFTGVGAPTINCVVGRDTYTDTVAQNYYVCTAVNTWRLVPTL
jgi:hypothetical protein